MLGFKSKWNHRDLSMMIMNSEQTLRNMENNTFTHLGQGFEDRDSKVPLPSWQVWIWSCVVLMAVLGIILTSAAISRSLKVHRKNRCRFCCRQEKDESVTDRRTLNVDDVIHHFVQSRDGNPLYIPTEDELERLQELGISYYDDEDWFIRVPDGILNRPRRTQITSGNQTKSVPIILVSPADVVTGPVPPEADLTAHSPSTEGNDNLSFTPSSNEILGEPRNSTHNQGTENSKAQEGERLGPIPRGFRFKSLPRSPRDITSFLPNPQDVSKTPEPSNHRPISLESFPGLIKAMINHARHKEYLVDTLRDNSSTLDSSGIYRLLHNNQTLPQVAPRILQGSHPVDYEYGYIDPRSIESFPSSSVKNITGSCEVYSWGADSLYEQINPRTPIHASRNSSCKEEGNSNNLAPQPERRASCDSSHVYMALCT